MIESETPITPCSRQQFKEIDSAVMKAAYDTHNRFGRLCDERVYENDLAARLRAQDMTAYTQVALRVRHQGFEKTYRLDLVVDSMVYELKVVEQFSKAHDAQALNYAALLAIPRIKLLSFGADRVQGRLVASPFDEQSRYPVLVDDSCWRPLTENCKPLSSLWIKSGRSENSFMRGGFCLGDRQGVA